MNFTGFVIVLPDASVMKSRSPFTFALGFAGGLIVVLVVGLIFKLKEKQIEKPSLFQASRAIQENENRDNVSFSFSSTKQQLKPYPKRFVNSEVQEALGQKTLVARIEKLGEVLKRVGAEDMNSVIDLIQKIPNGYERKLLSQLALLQLAQENPAEALQKMEGLDDKRTSDWELQRGIMTSWSQKEPEKAKAFLEDALKNSKNGQNTALTSALSEVLAGRDPESALDYAMKISEGYERSQALDSIGKAWAKQDLQAATDYALQKLEGEARVDFLKEVARGWGKESLPTAFQWAQNLPASFEERGQIISEVVRSWGWFDPQSAAGIVEKLPEGKERETLVAALAESWISKDAKQAVQWLEKQSEVRGFVYAEVPGRWAWNDPDAARDWLQALPRTQLRDEAIELFVRHMGRLWLSEDSRAATANLATTINNETTRFKSIQSIVKSWKREDREAAAAWVNAIDLSEEQKATLLSD